MPVTAKLSRKFYETLGDDLAAELVDWFNQVDATYRADLTAMNDANWARFEAKLEQFKAELRADMAAMRAELLKWMFLYWAGTALTVIGLLRFRP